jgi:hypothetical protein
MTKRGRNYVVMAISAVLGFVYGKLSGDWSDVVFVAGLAAVIATIGAAGNVWLEFAPDGAFRRKPRA